MRRTIAPPAPRRGLYAVAPIADPRDISMVDPTSYAARRWVHAQVMTVLPARGFTMADSEFQNWMGGKKPRLETFYRHQR